MSLSTIIEGSDDGPVKRAVDDGLARWIHSDDGYFTLDQKAFCEAT